MPKSPPKRGTWYSVALIAAPVGQHECVVVGDPNLVTLTLSSGFRFQGFRYCRPRNSNVVLVLARDMQNRLLQVHQPPTLDRLTVIQVEESCFMVVITSESPDATVTYNWMAG